MKLVKTDLYLLLIDEEAEINTKSLVLDEDNVIGEILSITKKYGYRTKLLDGGEAHYYPNMQDEEKIFKIIAYYPLTKEAKELDLPLLPTPFKNEDVELLALVAYPKNSNENIEYILTKVIRPKWVEGYKAAQSDKQLPKEFAISDKFSTFEENLKNGKYKW